MNALQRWISDARTDAHYALRRLRSSPSFAALAILTIAFGIGATTAIFSVVNAVVLRPLPVDHPEQVVSISEVNPAGAVWTTSEPNYLEYRDRTRSFSTVAAISGRGASLLEHGDPIALNGLGATASYFSLFGRRALLGAPYLPDNDHPGGDTRVIALSEGIWRRVFGGDPTIVGRTIDLDGVPYRVLGVMPAGYGYLPSDFWVPLAPDPSSNRGSHLLTALGRLRAGVSIAQADADARGVAAELSRLYPKSNTAWGARVGSFADFIVGQGLKQQLVVLFAAVGFLLLLTCANVANLLLARASSRQREMSVRAALGAGTGRIVRQLVTESLMLSAVGAALGVGLAWAAIPTIRHINATNIPRIDEVTVDARVLAFAVCAAVFTGLLFGFAPALHASKTDLQGALREGGRSVAGAGRRVRDGLVVLEVSVAVVLLVGAGLLGRSFERLIHVSPGFNLQDVLQFTISAPNDLARDQRALYFDRIQRAVAAVPAVASIGASSIAPFSGGNTQTQFFAEDHEARPGEYFAADWRSATPGLFATLGIALVRGRVLDANDTQDHPNVAVIDETMAARLWPGRDPIGKRIMAAQSARTPKDWFEVIGVVRDIRDQSLATAPAPGVYFAESQKPWVQLTFFVRPRGTITKALLDAIRQAVREGAPATPVPDITPLASNVDSALAPQRFTAALLGGFAAAALLLAAMGIYGVISFSVAERAAEMGIRLAFGATAGRLMAMVMRESGVVVALGATLGAAAAMALSQLISSLLFDTGRFDASTYAATLLLLVIVAALATYLPARRAARSDPLVALRER